MKPTVRSSSCFRRAFLRAALALVLLGALSGLYVPSAGAQSSFITHRITKLHESPPSMGREFWFGIPSNLFGQGQDVYLRLYITSPYNTTAYIAQGSGTPRAVSVSAYKISTFDISPTWELQSSAQPDLAVHVWSNDADLTVYFNNHAFATTDGTLVIPTIGWGTDYVVAGYASLYEGNADYPSEFTIAANEDNTTVQITPSCDIRMGSQPLTVAYQAGHTYNFTMQRGEARQFLSVQAQDVQGYDVTGTIIHSNHPIGVIGGSMCTNIPLDYPYCDHVEHMMPPVRTWATTYYSTYFTQPTGQQGHDWGNYCFISSKPGQQIWDYNLQQGKTLVATIPSQYGVQQDVELEKAQKFFSDAPFLVVEYINSSTYPDGRNGSGDPAEVVINPREQYTKTVVFETPAQSAGLQPYNSFTTVIVNVKDLSRTTFDGQPILKYNNTAQHLDDTFDVFTVPVLPGVHIITGDSAGVGAYVYGYGFDESYAWVGSFGVGTFHATDTISPRADTLSACYHAFIHLSDTGTLQTGLAKIQIDSDYNMSFSIDSDWLEGAGVDTSGYGMSVSDRTKPGYLSVTVYDVAGNETTIISTYKPNDATITPAIQDFGTVAFPGSATLYDTIHNAGQTTFDIQKLALKLANQGFTLVSPDMSPLPADSSRAIEIVFSPQKGQEAYDTINFGNDCLSLSAIVEGNGGGADYSVDDQTWLNVPLTKDTGWVQLPVVIHNKTALKDITVKFDSVSDPTHFYLAPYQPATVTVPKKQSQNGPDGLDSVWFIYQPTAIEQDKAKGYWEAAGVNTDGTLAFRNDSLFGNPVVANVTFTQNIEDTVNCPSAGDRLRFTFVLANSGSQDALINRVYASDTIDFSAPIGVMGNDSTWDPAKQAQLLAKGGGADTIVVTYLVPVGGNFTAVDTITAYDASEQPLGKVIAHIVVNQLSMLFNPPMLDFGQVPYQGPKVTKMFTITNPNGTPVTYTNISFALENGCSPGSYSSSTTPPLPVTLDSGQSMTVSVTFDPSASYVDSQWVDLQFATNACDTSLRALAISGLPRALTQSTVASPILACSNTMDTITISNPGPVADTVIGMNWLAGDSGAFMVMLDRTDSLAPANGSIRIPVEFLPNAQDSTLHISYDTIAFTLKNSRTVSTVVATVQGTSNFVDVLVSSKFPPPSGNAGTTANLPMALTVNPRNLTVNDSDLNITGVRLEYLISNPDVLNISNLSNAITGLPPGWKVMPSSYVSKLGDTLILFLQGPKLPNGTTSLGTIAFTVTLAKTDSTTNVTLAQLEFFSDSATAGCIDPMVADSNFSLIFRCGDATLRGYMQGGGIIAFIRSATPDPVTGTNVTFEYGNAVPATLTLTIYDVLGREVARPVDHVYHEAGAWEASANVAKLPAGTYTYRLSSVNGAVVSKQFVIDR